MYFYNTHIPEHYYTDVSYVQQIGRLIKRMEDFRSNLLASNEAFKTDSQNNYNQFVETTTGAIDQFIETVNLSLGTMETDIETFKNTTNQAIADFKTTVNGAIADFKSDVNESLADFGTEIQTFKTSVNNTISGFSAELDEFSTLFNSIFENTQTELKVKKSLRTTGNLTVDGTISGTVTEANKLVDSNGDLNIGSDSQAIYFQDGKPKASTKIREIIAGENIEIEIENNKNKISSTIFAGDGIDLSNGKIALKPHKHYKSSQVNVGQENSPFKLERPYGEEQTTILQSEVYNVVPIVSFASQFIFLQLQQMVTVKLAPTSIIVDENGVKTFEWVGGTIVNGCLWEYVIELKVSNIDEPVGYFTHYNFKPSKFVQSNFVSTDFGTLNEHGLTQSQSLYEEPSALIENYVFLEGNKLYGSIKGWKQHNKSDGTTLAFLPMPNSFNIGGNIAFNIVNIQSWQDFGNAYPYFQPEIRPDGSDTNLKYIGITASPQLSGTVGLNGLSIQFTDPNITDNLQSGEYIRIHFDIEFIAILTPYTVQYYS